MKIQIQGTGWREESGNLKDHSKNTTVKLKPLFFHTKYFYANQQALVLK